MRIEQETDMAGKIRIKWQSQATLLVHSYKFSSEPTDEQLQALSDRSDEDAELAEVIQADLSILAYKDTIIQMIEAIKDRPAVTFAQFNTFLDGLHWGDQAVLRFFIWVLANRLAERNGVLLTDIRDNIIFATVRDFIVETPLRKLARLILNKSEL